VAGLGFIHLGFLAAAAAVAVPILIHLLFRPRARKMEIGSLWFLRLVMRDSARRRKVRRWVLLALRALGVLLLALLFARPYRIDAAASGSERELILLIDRSASMGASGGRATPFAKAQQEAAEILRDLPAGTTAHLAYFDAEGAEPEREARIDTALEPRPAGTDYGKALAWARDIAIASRRGNREVLLWTDLQRSGIRSRVEPPFPPTGVRVEVNDVGRPITRNLAVDLVEAERTDLRKGKPVRITARIFNAGFFPARNVPVKLALDGNSPIEQTITIEGRTRALLSFDVPIDEPGVYSGFVEVKGDDELSFDNRRYVAFETRLPERVLLVDGEPGPSVFGNETYYLETALRLGLPGNEAKEAPPTPYEPVRIEAAGPAYTLPDLDGFRVVVLCNVAGVSRESAGSLSRFVDAGGSLVIFLGDHASESANATLLDASLLPGRIGEQSEQGPYRIADWNKNHPILAPFADPLHGDLRTLRFQKIARITPVPEAHVLAAAQGGLPILLERTHGRGRCVLFAIPADNAWGEWAIHRLYLPLVHQVAGYLTDRLPGTGRVRAAPAGRAATEAPGVTVEQGRALVRNVDPEESDVERTTAAKFREAYRLPASVAGDLGRNQRGDGLGAGAERPDELWRTIAWILLFVLVVETFVANKTYA
jgi:Aerotolerance regulator N-terminal